MKKELSVILSASLILSCIPLSFTAGAESDKVSFEKTAVVTQPLNIAEEAVEVDCLVRSDLPEVPFVNVESYLDLVYDLDKSSSLGDSVYKFENGGYSMALDAEKDTVSFDCYEGFIMSNLKSGAQFPTYPFVEGGNGFELYGDINSVELDLSKYDLDIVERDGSLYMPFCALNEIFSNADFSMTYKSGKFNCVSVMGQMGAKGKFGSERTKAYAEMCYNDLCFMMDNFYGKPSNAKLTAGIIKDGFDKTLETYDSVTPRVKELLLSESIEEYCTGLMLLQGYIDDGGHTHLEFSIEQRLANYGVSTPAAAAKKVFGDTDNADAAAIIAQEEETDRIAAKLGFLLEERANAYKSCELVKEWSDSKLYRTGDTFFYTFGYFGPDAAAPFKEAMDLASANGGKYFIVDVTANGGGDPVVGAYMLSLMSDSATYMEKYCVSGTLSRFNGRIDKNLDGKFDEKDDEVKYDLKCAVLGCIDTYSCPNEFACFAQDHGICILGERTRGGSCSVTARLLPNGTCCNISGFSMCLRESGKDADDGASPDVPLPGYEQDYKGFFDLNAMKKGIAEFYGDAVPQAAAIFGDIDGDEQITANDALKILRASVGAETFGGDQKAIADVDGDSEITANDALDILRFSVGLVGENSRINTALTA